MRQALHRSLTASVVPALLGLAGCSDDGGTVDPGFTDQQIIVDFVDQVVVPTYELLDTRAGELDTAVAALANDPSQVNLDAAQAAWIATRIPWEQSEGFLFGPVDAYGYDPAMDSWPVNQTDLDAVLDSGDEFSTAYVGNLSETQKGFHTVEYLLFGEANGKVAGDLTQRQLQYMVAITDELHGVTTALASSWTESADGGAPYRDTFATAGEEGNTAYPSLSSAAQEMVDAMIGIADEVANGKIADPYDAQDPNLVESQFSYNSLADFQDNVRSMQNVYMGDVPAAGTTGRGLNEFVAAENADLDAQIQAEITAALTALQAIPDPFSNAILDPTVASTIEASQAALNTLMMTLEGELLPLVQ